MTQRVVFLSIMGLIVTWKGFSCMFLVKTGIVTLSILLYYALHGRHARAKVDTIPDHG
ncbi:hypothetical protein [Desulfotruncus arcticus]|uniref:hypothetical protein n=1 Tax=Desulfotruncus arcticus TaxID=341036 RepID=UPI0013F4D6C4|nr:hypothetical protein [Desulfotruncus arcticus]